VAGHRLSCHFIGGLSPARLQFSMAFDPWKPYANGFIIENALNRMHLKGTGTPW